VIAEKAGELTMKTQQRTLEKSRLWTETMQSKAANVVLERRTGNASSTRRSIARTVPSLPPGIAYQKRLQVVLRLGFATYQEYLASSMWKDIRETVLLRDKCKCKLCGSAATQVHHLSYSYKSMSGKALYLLLSVCSACHKAIEFDGTRKLSLGEANNRANLMLRAVADLKKKDKRKAKRVVCIKTNSKEDKRKQDRKGKKEIAKVVESKRVLAIDSSMCYVKDGGSNSNWKSFLQKRRDKA